MYTNYTAAKRLQTLEGKSKVHGPENKDRVIFQLGSYTLENVREIYSLPVHTA